MSGCDRAGRLWREQQLIQKDKAHPDRDRNANRNPNAQRGTALGRQRGVPRGRGPVILPVDFRLDAILEEIK
jgi:hypothetical protein